MSTNVPVAPISVIVPCYNGGRFLRRCLPAVFGQTVRPAEVIVIDDGSTQDPADRVLAELGLPVRLIRHATNQGLPAARNTGIRAAAGEYVALHDNDDVWRPQKLAKQLALFEARPDLDAVFCDFAQAYPDGKPAHWRGGLLAELKQRGALARAVGDSGYWFAESLRDLLIIHTSFIHPSTIVIRRSIFDRVGLFDESLRHMEDLDMWIRLAALGRLGLVDCVLVGVEQRPDSLGHQNVAASEYLIKMYSRLQSDFTDLPVAVCNTVAKRLLQEHDSLGWTYRNHGDRAKALEHQREALRMAPTFRRRLALWKTYLLPFTGRKACARTNGLNGQPS